jgi:hypothetical protein
MCFNVLLNHLKKVQMFSKTKSLKLIVTFLIGSINIHAAVSDSTKVIKSLNEAPFVHATQVYRTFEGLTPLLKVEQPDPILIPLSSLADSIAEKRSHAYSLLEKVKLENRFSESLDALSVIDLPIGVVKSGGVADYSILIDHMTFNSRGATMEVYMSLEIPQTGDHLAFNGSVPLSANGGIAGKTKIYLLGDHYIKITSGTLLTIKGSKNTYAEFDCAGFQGISIEAEIEFSRDQIIPEDSIGNSIPEPARVKTNFTTYIQSWNDLMIGVTIPPFQVKGLKGIGFSVHQAFVDLSDLTNPPGLKFPKNYTSSFTQGEQPNLWQGIYLQRAEVRLPRSLEKKDKVRVTLGAEHMIIDDQGFTGGVFAENVFQDGDMSGWNYSLDHVELEVITNDVKGFELKGKLSIPALKSKDGNSTQFDYTAHRSADGNYTFAVEVKNNLRLPFLIADLNLSKGSSVIVKEKNNKLYPTAILSGDLSIKNTKANFSKILFEDMLISSEAPYFEIRKLGFGSEQQSVSNFPVVINSISVQKESNKIGIAFNLIINIGGKPEDEGFGGAAALTIWGKQESNSIKNSEGQIIRTEHDWKFDKIDLSDVAIKIGKPGVYDLAGTINFFEKDAVYGNGFKGELTGSLSKFGGIKATALFGRTENFRYWHADALVTLGKGIPIVPGALFATGFGGGFYSKMKQTDKSPGTSIGATKSGIYYIPDEKSTGIKAIMNIGTLRPEAVNGDVGLEVSINNHGGINSVIMTGNANFMNLIKLGENKIKELASANAGGKLSEKLASLVKGQVFGNMKLEFDNVNDVFHGNIEVYVNVAGGLMRGIGTGNKAGWAVLHFEKSDWYVLIGTPDEPIGLEVAKIFKSKSYFMLGKHLPGSPPPPSQVSEILGNVNLDYMRDMNALESGTGFAFGLQSIIDTGDLNFLMFYGRFSAGTGVDFMLKDYGENCHCEGSSGSIGINGWYANGQAYAFVQGKIGIKVRLRFVKGNFEILGIGAAAILQAKGPNPFWMRGNVGGYYRILGGLVKGKCNFEVTVGKDCKIVVPQSQEEINPLQDVSIIAELSPSADTKDVDVFTAPQAAFNMPIGEVFDITDATENRRLFRGRLDSFKVLDGTTSVTGNIRWNETNDVAAFDAFDVLPPTKQLKAFVKVIFEENREGQWQTMTFEGKPLEETKEISFTTGEAPDYIPTSNVDISYPAIGQFNFYPKEYNQGFIELKKGQGYLFKPGSDWKQKVHFTNAISETFLETDLTYNESDKRVYFNIPSGLQVLNTYKLELLNFPVQNKLLDANVKKVEQNVSSNGAELTLTTKQLEGNLELREVKSIYSSLFKTSSFNTFKEKITTITLSNTFRESIGSNVFQLVAYLRGKEFFDKAEVAGNFSDRQVNFEAVLDDNDWYRKEVFPVVYDGFPFGSMSIRYRNTADFGFPPVKSIYIDQAGYEPIVTEENLSPIYAPTSEFNSVRYDIMAPMKLDYLDIQNQIANYVTDKGSVPKRWSSLLITPFPIYNYGKYKVRVSYVIPRIHKTTSTHEWELFNNIQN